MVTPTQTDTPSKPPIPWLFFALVIVLMIPLWLMGNARLPLPVVLPVSALGFVVPVIAGVIYAAVTGGWRSAWNLLKRAVDYRKVQHKVWLLVAFLLAPVIYFITYLVLRAANAPLPRWQFSWLSALAFLVIYLIAGAGEELGWTGIATDPLQARWGALGAGILLGVFWALWHVIPWIETGNNPSWVLWQTLSAVPTRVLIFWLYNNSSKSVLAAIIFHAMVNVSWSLFPNNGSGFNPLPAFWIMTAIILVIVIIWDPKTFNRLRLSSARTQQDGFQN